MADNPGYLVLHRPGDVLYDDHITDEQLELILDVLKEPELGGGRHLVDVRGDGNWVIEHSLVCRRTKKMTECPWIEEVYRASLDAYGLPFGRSVLSHDELSGDLVCTREGAE